MAAYTLQTITAAQAGSYAAATDSLSLGDVAPFAVTVAYLADGATISMPGQSVTFGSGIFGDQDLTFASGGRLFVGGAGADLAPSSNFGDRIYGGDGGDTLDGGLGDDAIQGNQGADIMMGGAGNDFLYGGQDNDQINLGSGADEANFTNGNKGDDTITASQGHDSLLGGQGNDMLVGGGGGDFLNGNLGDDTIQGGVGDDTILGEGGHDVMSGGGGADVYRFDAGSSAVSADGADVIMDWSAIAHIDLSVQGGYGEVVPQMMTDIYGYPIGQQQYDFGGMLDAANSMMAGNGAVQIVAGAIGGDVGVFVDTNGDHQVDLAILLAGVDLGAVSAGNFI